MKAVLINMNTYLTPKIEEGIFNEPTNLQIRRILVKATGQDLSHSTIAMLMTVFMKYGIAPLVCVLFASWLQQKDMQLLDYHKELVVLIEKTTLAIEKDSQILEQLSQRIDRERK